MNKYWIYIVDNHQRDLSSICWWALESNFHENDKICLLPKFEVNPKILSREKPDVIVWNYARPNNIKWIKLAHELGIQNIVHDTEGIPRDVSTYFNGIKETHLKYIDEIWCWGITQAQFLEKRFSKIKNLSDIKITGSIRYEYAKSLEKVTYQNNINKIIWNTSFSTLSPKFQSPWREFTQHHEYLELSEEETLNKFISFAAERQISTEYIKLVASYSQENKITLRPHPFESENFYLKTFKESFKNIEFSTSGDVHLDLNKHSLVLQYGCQTALDAFIRGVPSIKTIDGNINMWSKVTPFVDPIILREKISDINFLEEIYEIQKKLFVDNQINLMLYNLDKPIKIKEKFYAKKRGLKGNLKLNFLKIKYFIKDLIQPSEIQDIRKSLTSKNINEFLLTNYSTKNWHFKNNICVIKRFFRKDY